MRYVMLFFLCLIVGFSFGCTCINSKQLSEEEFRGYNLVVKGTIVSIETMDRAKKILIKVTDIYKGSKGQSEVVVMTDMDDSCGISPKINETWLIYSLEMAQYNYYTDICTKSKNVNAERSAKSAKEFDREMKFLNKKRIQDSK